MVLHVPIHMSGGCLGVRVSQHLKYNHNCMPRISELLRQSVEDSTRLDSAWCVRLAYSLKMDVSRAIELFETYGVGHIYTSTGFVIADSPRNRCRLSGWSDGCVIVDEDMNIRVRTSKNIGSMNRKKNAIKKVVDERAEKRRRMEDMAINEREHMFETMQTGMFRKRQGKANSHGDIGQYKNVWRASIADSIPAKRDVFVRIVIK